MKSIALILLIGIPFFPNGCGEKIESHWSEETMNIEGNGEDWTDKPMQYNEDMKIVYAILNNQQTLSLMLRFNDPKLAQMFSMRGFTLWINDQDDEEKKIGIHYRDERMKDRFLSGIRNPDQRKNREQTDLRLQVIKPMGQFFFASNDTISGITIDSFVGFKAAAGYSNGVYCFEFQFPLQKTNGSSYYINNPKNNQVKVGMEISGLTDEEKEKIKEEMAEQRGSGMSGGISGEMGGGRSGGMGGGRAGGRRGGGMRGDGPQIPDMDGEIYWVTVKMAQKN